MSLQQNPEYQEISRKINTLSQEDVRLKLKNRLRLFSQKIAGFTEVQKKRVWKQVRLFVMRRLRSKKPGKLRELTRQLHDRLRPIEDRISALRDTKNTSHLIRTIESVHADHAVIYKAYNRLNKGGYSLAKTFRATFRDLGDLPSKSDIINLSGAHKKRIMPMIARVQSLYDDIKGFVAGNSVAGILKIAGYLTQRLVAIQREMVRIRAVAVLAAKEKQNKREDVRYVAAEKVLLARESIVSKKVAILQREITSRTKPDLAQNTRIRQSIARYKKQYDVLARKHASFSGGLNNRIHRHLVRLKEKFAGLLRLESQLAYERSLMFFQKKNNDVFHIKKGKNGFLLVPQSLAVIQQKLHLTQKAARLVIVSRSRKFFMQMSGGSSFTAIPVQLLAEYRSLMPADLKLYFGAAISFKNKKLRESIDRLRAFLRQYDGNKSDVQYRKAKKILQKLTASVGYSSERLFRLNRYSLSGAALSVLLKQNPNAALLAEQKEHVKQNKEWYKKNLGFFFAETEGVHQRRTLAQVQRLKQLFDSKIRSLQQYKEYVFSNPTYKNAKDKTLRVLHHILIQQPDYHPDEAMFSRALEGKGGNCEAQTKLTVSLLQKVFPNLEVRVQQFSDHVQPLVRVQGQWYVMYGSYPQKVDVSYLEGTEIFSPKEFINIFLSGRSKNSRFRSVRKYKAVYAKSKAVTNTNLKWNSSHRLRSYNAGAELKPKKFVPISYEKARQRMKLSQTLQRRRTLSSSARRTSLSNFDIADIGGEIHNTRVQPALKKHLNFKYIIGGREISGDSVELLYRLLDLLSTTDRKRLRSPSRVKRVRFSMSHLGMVSFKTLQYVFPQDRVSASRLNKFMVYAAFGSMLKTGDFSSISPAAQRRKVIAFLKRKKNFFLLVHQVISQNPKTPVRNFTVAQQHALDSILKRTSPKTLGNFFDQPNSDEHFVYFMGKGSGFRRLALFQSLAQATLRKIKTSSSSPSEKQRAYVRLLYSLERVRQMMIRGGGKMRLSYQKLSGANAFGRVSKMFGSIDASQKIRCLFPNTFNADVLLQSWWNPFQKLYQSVYSLIVRKNFSAIKLKKPKKKFKANKVVSNYSTLRSDIYDARSVSFRLFNNYSDFKYRRYLYQNRANLASIRPRVLLQKFPLSFKAQRSSRHVRRRPDFLQKKFASEKRNFQLFVEVLQRSGVSLPSLEISGDRGYFEYHPVFDRLESLTISSYDCFISRVSDLVRLKNLRVLSIQLPLKIRRNGGFASVTDLRFLLKMKGLRTVIIDTRARLQSGDRRKVNQQVSMLVSQMPGVQIVVR